MSQISVTLVKSLHEDKLYSKVDGKFTSRPYLNTIGIQMIDDNIDALFNQLEKLQGYPTACMVYGHAIEPMIKETDRTLRNFKEEPTHVLTLDLDEYEGGNCATYLGKTTYEQAVEDAKEFVKLNLPPEFQGVTFILRFSTSFGLGKHNLLRAHIVFLLEESWYPRELYHWIRDESLPVDSTFYRNLTQPVFTAGPVWKEIGDPLSFRPGHFPRISIVKGHVDKVPETWRVPKLGGKTYRKAVGNLTNARDIAGTPGAFCRAVEMGKALELLGYTEVEEGRFLSPTSQSKLPGAMVFPNGYVYSHHEGDPINVVIEKVFHNKRFSLNVYDLLKGHALLVADSDPTFQKELDYMLVNSMTGDHVYQEEVISELEKRTEWLVEGPYKGNNRLIIDTLLRDMVMQHMNDGSRSVIFEQISANTKKKVTKQILQTTWNSIKRRMAADTKVFDPEASLRMMGNLIMRQDVLYSHHMATAGDFYAFYKNKGLWRRLNKDQTEAYIYRHVHSAIPQEQEIEIHKTAELTKLVLKLTCETNRAFIPSPGWAFKGGKYGILMDGLFGDDPWHPDQSTVSLNKHHRISKELPITYREWMTAQDSPPLMFLDFLARTTQEDYEQVAFICEYIGYILADVYTIHKFLIIEGVPGSGKSLLSNIIREVVGSERYAAISLNNIGGSFGLSELPGKQVAVMSEAREIDFSAMRRAAPILLKIVGQDSIDINAKYKAAITEHLRCKILVLTNRTPIIPEDTGALTQRVMLMRLNKSFRGTREEILGLDKMIVNAELPQIVRYCLESLARLARRGNFDIPDSVKRSTEVYTRQVDPLKSFVETHFYFNEPTRSRSVAQSDFTVAFSCYLERIGQFREHAVTRKRCKITDLQSLFPNKFERMQVKSHGKNVRRFVGIAPKEPLKMEFAAELQELGMVIEYEYEDEI